MGSFSIADTVVLLPVFGRVYPMIDASQATGRFSVTRPGQTVMSKKSGREIFVPAPDQVIVTADLAQIDARAIAAHCQDPAYLAMFGPGRDLHTEVAIRVLGSADHRSIAKVINHATSYGAGAPLIARTANVSRAEAERYLDDMKRAYPQWDEWRREITRKAEVVQLLDNGFGRMVRANPDRISTTAVAMFGQSCARDLLVEYMTFDWAPRQGLTPVRILPTVSQGALTWGAAYGH